MQTILLYEEESDVSTDGLERGRKGKNHSKDTVLCCLKLWAPIATVTSCCSLSAMNFVLDNCVWLLIYRTVRKYAYIFLGH